MPIPDGYSFLPGGYYYTDGSGPYSIDSDGVPRLFGTGAGEQAIRDRLPSALGGQPAPAALAVVQAPFTPIPGSTVTTTATTTSAAITVPAGATSLRLLASATAYLTFGASGATATTSSMPLMAGVAEAVGVPSGATHYALVTATGTASVSVTGGAGG